MKRSINFFLFGLWMFSPFFVKADHYPINKNIDVKSPPLLTMKVSDKKQVSLQIVDVRFVDEFIFLHCYATEDKDGGKALIRLKPV